MDGPRTPFELAYYHGRMAGACSLLTIAIGIGYLAWSPMILILLPFAGLTGYHAARALFRI